MLCMSTSGRIGLTPWYSLPLDTSGHTYLSRTHPLLICLRYDGAIDLPPVPPVQGVTETGGEASVQEGLPKEATTFNTYHQHLHQHLPEHRVQSPRLLPRLTQSLGERQLYLFQ